MDIERFAIVEELVGEGVLCTHGAVRLIQGNKAYTNFGNEQKLLK